MPRLLLCRNHVRREDDVNSNLNDVVTPEEERDALAELLSDAIERAKGLETEIERLRAEVRAWKDRTMTCHPHAGPCGWRGSS